MAEDAKHRGNTPDPNAVKTLFEKLIEIEEEKKALGERAQEIKREASVDHNITTRSINEVQRRVKKIMTTGQLEFDDLLAETDVLWDALMKSGFEIPQPAAEETEEGDNVVALDGQKEDH